MSTAADSPHSWSKNADQLAKVSSSPKAGQDVSYWLAVRGIADLACHIRDTDLSKFLFGNISKHALMIRQTDEPYPWSVYLHVQPLESGEVEFRYVDTNIEKRQWHRVVSPNETVQRFHKFMDQLRWVPAATRLT